MRMRVLILTVLHMCVRAPFVFSSNICGWLFIDTNTVRSTCATKAEVLKFLLWVGDDTTADAASRAMSASVTVPHLTFSVLPTVSLLSSARFQIYESPVVASLAKNVHIAMLPAMYLEQSNLLERLRREVLCRGDTLVSSDSTSASISGNAMLASSVNLMTQLYAQIDSSKQMTARQSTRARNEWGWPTRLLRQSAHL